MDWFLTHYTSSMGEMFSTFRWCAHVYLHHVGVPYVSLFLLQGTFHFVPLFSLSVSYAATDLHKFCDLLSFAATRPRLGQTCLLQNVKWSTNYHKVSSSNTNDRLLGPSHIPQKEQFPVVPNTPKGPLTQRGRLLLLQCRFRRRTAGRLGGH